MFKSIALVAVCSAAIVSGGSAKAATSYDFSGLSLSYSSETHTLVSSASSYTSFLTALTSALGANSANVIDMSAYSALSSYVSGLTGVSGSGSNLVYSSVSKTIKGKTYYTWTNVLTMTNATSSTDATVSFGGQTLTASVTAVPGPIAGAGLPVVLGVIGFAAWRRRKGAVAA